MKMRGIKPCGSCNQLMAGTTPSRPCGDNAAAQKHYIDGDSIVAEIAEKAG